MLRRVQEWLADRGWMQYPLPRRRLRVYYEPGEIAVRLVIATVGGFWTLVLGVATLMMAYVFAVFVLAALGAL